MIALSRVPSPRGTRAGDGLQLREELRDELLGLLSGGATTVRFTHSNLRDQESVRSHEGGWRNAFDNLETKALAPSDSGL